MLDLSPEEIKRYGRHLLLPEFGKAGQLKLKQAKVLLIGAGGLGSPQILYLTAAGIGTIGLVDFDRVDFSNLQRQVIHFTADVGKPKVISAQEKIAQINPEVRLIPYETKLTADNALEIFRDYDVIIDGTDNFPTRYLINDACIILGKPFIYGGIFRFEGQCSVFGWEDGPCYRCFFQDPPQAGEVPSCAEAGVLGILPGIIGLLQSNEAVKLICGIGETLKGRLLLLDALTTRFRDVRIKKNPECPACGTDRKIHKLVDVQPTCKDQAMNEENSDESIGHSGITVLELKEIMDRNPENFVLLDVREPVEWDIVRINGAVHKPLSSLTDQYQDIPQDKIIAVYCKMGGRSAQAIEFLRSKGYEKTVNVVGGIDAWGDQIEPELVRY